MSRIPTTLFCASSLLSVFLVACGEPEDPKPEDTGPTIQVVDEDHDGWASEDDCDDHDPAVNPGENEICDGIDNDCDNSVDEGVMGLFYTDADGDGFGDPDLPVAACEAGPGVVADATDCDDGDAAVNAASSEVCDDMDNNCNGAIDEGMERGPWYLDADGDGVGVEGDQVEGCDIPEGYVAEGGDCDDTDPAAFPGNLEVCDGVDNDCDGVTDGADAEGVTVWYQDADGDGFGDDSISQQACEQPASYVALGGDCDDANAGANPAATEICDDDDVDEDCNGLSDSEDPGTDMSSMMLFYPDADGDGYGDAAGTGVLACDGVSGTVSNNDDCDDGDLLTNPMVLELCDGEDDNCNGVVDDNPVDGDTWYLDEDADGYGVFSDQLESCTPVSGYALVAGDCDDSDPSLTPEAGCGADTGDTGMVVDSRDGTYEGEGTLTVDLMGIPDTCTFTDLVLVMDEASSPQLSGSASCTFGGFFSAFGVQTATLDGDITTDPAIEGSVTVGTYVAETWTGTFAEDSLEGSFSGSGSWSGLAVTFSCEFTAER